MSESKSHLVLVLALTMAGVAPGVAGMNGTDWLVRMEKLRAAQSTPQVASWVSARVKSVNVSAGTISVSHGAIKSVGMPAMTMTFPVKDTTQLATVKKGERVNIQVAGGSGLAQIVDLRAQ